MEWSKKIIHIDMDAFYSSVEELDDPSLDGKPVIIGGSPHGRGVVCTANYAARKFGVRSAMPCKMAFKLCPEGLFLPPRFKRYQEISQKIFSFYREVTPLVEPLSLDEAYLDVTQNSYHEDDPVTLARTLKLRILEDIGLSASAGVATSKFMAKIASDYEKPAGLTVVFPGDEIEFLSRLPVKKIPGVGPKTEERLHLMGIKLIEDVRKFPIEVLEKKLGKFGPILKERSLGIDKRKVGRRSKSKSLGKESTFKENIYDKDICLQHLAKMLQVLIERIEEKDLSPKTLTLKYRYSDFSTHTRAMAVTSPIKSTDLMKKIKQELAPLKLSPLGLRLLGLSFSNFTQGESEKIIPLPFDECPSSVFGEV